MNWASDEEFSPIHVDEAAVDICENEENLVIYESKIQEHTVIHEPKMSDVSKYQEQEDYCDYQVLNDEISSEHSTHVENNVNSCAYSWMTPTSIGELERLLNKWNFESLFPVFREECIDVNALRVMTPDHLKQLSNKWSMKLGLQIMFGNCLISWQNSGESNGVISTRTEQGSKYNNANKNEFYGSTSNVSEETNDPLDFSLNIEKLLKSSSQGRTILYYYENNSKLNDGSRTVLVELIINYMIQKDIRMTGNLAKQTAEAILKVFPTEFLGYYYSKQSAKKPRGKIYDKYFNAIRKLKNNGILIKRPYSSKPVIQKRVLHIDAPELNIDDSIESLILDNCTWAEVESHWAATKNYRLAEIISSKSLSDILNKWRQYKKPMGFKLIDMDFKHLFPNTESLLIHFEAFASKIISIFQDRIKDQHSRGILLEMIEMKNITENGRCCGILFLMHSILIPLQKLLMLRMGKKFIYDIP